MSSNLKLLLGSSVVTITQSQFLRNKAEQDCAGLAAANSSLVLTATVFFENVSAGDGAALCLEGIADGSSVTYNTIVSNRSEKILSPNIIYVRSGRFPTFSQNNISNNIGYDLFNESPELIRASHNWWGTIHEAEIRRRIYDRAQDDTKGGILISPILQGAVTLPSVPPSP